jgi:hypothetical protein
VSLALFNQNDLGQGDALPPLVLTSALGRVIKKVNISFWNMLIMLFYWAKT